MNQGPPPPQLPPGWIALWDETTQRYYYVDQATGTTQWEIPSGASKATEAGMPSVGEASSYGGGGGAGAGGYPQQQPSPYSSSSQSFPQAGASPNTAVATAYPTQEDELNRDGTDRGIGKVFSGFSGGAITGGLLGYAAGKYFNKPKPNQYYPPPPPSSGGFGFGNFGGGHHGGRHDYYGGHNNHGKHHGGRGPGGPDGFGGPGGPGGPGGFNPPIRGGKHGW
ncbi:hypothetical protein BD408DRAFT_415758 [Parasitella parasitica]|nr:hypothetical protein BD408DRAFT_415758 [Parasitella parasitica]